MNSFSDFWQCQVCDGEVSPMGRLGPNEWGRCSGCGVDQSRPAEEEDQFPLDEAFSADYFLEYARKANSSRQQIAEEFKPFVQSLTVLKESRDLDGVVEGLFHKVASLKEAGVPQKRIEEGLGDAFGLIGGFLKQAGGHFIKNLVRKAVQWIASFFFNDMGVATVGVFTQAMMNSLGDAGLSGLVKIFTDCQFAAKMVAGALAEVLMNPKAELFTSESFAVVVAKAVASTDFVQNSLDTVAEFVCDKLGDIGGKLLGKAKSVAGAAADMNPLTAGIHKGMQAGEWAAGKLRQAF